MPTNSLLEVQTLTLRRGPKTLLNRLDWEVNPGEHWVIMGPNGCGKTSLLRSLTGFLTPTSGDITLLGETYGECDWREVRRNIALVSSSLQPHIPGGEPAIETVISGIYDQLDFWGEATPADHRLAKRLLTRLDAKEIIRREWAYLSQGERQRVLIARALAADPKVLILDEPCAGLDPIARAEFLVAMEKITSDPKGPTVILVTHHVEEITPGFTHLLLLSRGKKLSAGELKTHLTSAQLSAAFERPVRVRISGASWQLKLVDSPAA
ncbi:MAG: ATP-binding cassette domain-containing protein [Opitutaceae bacterium]|jgi:iron complex transport system ATP-binding protein|nr:ATP-binding cassette domain-containing protein [Opitutaceae bacterium]